MLKAFANFSLSTGRVTLLYKYVELAWRDFSLTNSRWLLFISFFWPQSLVIHTEIWGSFF